MQQSARRLAMFFGGSFLAGAGLFAAACGTDNGTTQVPTVDSGGRDTGGGNRDGNVEPGDEDSSTPPGDAGPDCANIPKPRSSPGPFCFSVADAGEAGAPAAKNCAGTDEICCSGGRLPNDGGFEPSRCEATPADPVNGGYLNTASCTGFQSQVKQYHCMEPSHCPGSGEVCCATASDAGSPMPGQDNDFPGCPVYFQSGRFTDGTRCRKTQCQAGELTMCSSDADCKNGKCVPLTLEGRYGGYCRL